MPNDQVRSYVVGTNGAAFVPTANFPVRLYTTGGTSPVGAIVRCTGGQDNAAIGIAKRGALTTGLCIAVAQNPGASFYANVSTTVAQGAPLKIQNGSRFTAASVTAGNHFCARAVRARTNAGGTYLEWVPGGTV